MKQKTISDGARQAILRSLDSAVSSLLALISREYAQLVQRTTGLYTEGAPEHVYLNMYNEYLTNMYNEYLNVYI